MSRKIILVSICALIVTARGLAQASNQDSAIAELQRQMDEMRSQMAKMQNRITELEAARGIAATNSSTDPVLLQNHSPMPQAALSRPEEAKSMIAVTAMGCQFALLRLALPVAPSTAVMTGNLTNAVLALVDSSSRTGPLMESDSKRLRGALHLLVGFFVGCVLATAALMYLGEWAWSLPAVLAGAAVALQ